MPAARMSVVLVTDTFRTIRRVLARLHEQTVKNQLEIVVVIPSGSREGDDTVTFEDFAAFRIVEVPTVHPMPVARAAGIRAATAPIVFLGETHSFPGAAFAEKLIAAHEGNWDAVVPGIANANPKARSAGGAFSSTTGRGTTRCHRGRSEEGPRGMSRTRDLSWLKLAIASS